MLIFDSLLELFLDIFVPSMFDDIFEHWVIAAGVAQSRRVHASTSSLRGTQPRGVRLLLWLFDLILGFSGVFSRLLGLEGEVGKRDLVHDLRVLRRSLWQG